MIPLRKCDFPPGAWRPALGRSCVMAAHGRRRGDFAHCCARGWFLQPGAVGRSCAKAVPARLVQSAVRAGGGARGTALAGGSYSAPISPGSSRKAAKASPLGALLSPLLIRRRTAKRGSFKGGFTSDAWEGGRWLGLEKEAFGCQPGGNAEKPRAAGAGELCIPACPGSRGVTLGVVGLSSARNRQATAAGRARPSRWSIVAFRL